MPDCLLDISTCVTFFERCILFREEYLLVQETYLFVLDWDFVKFKGHWFPISSAVDCHQLHVEQLSLQLEGPEGF